MSVEEQVALRLPEPLGKRLRYWLAQSGAPGVLPGEVLVESLDDYGQLFSFTMDGKSYPARLANMPTCVDTWKTVNHETYVKSGEIGQVIVVDEKPFPEGEVPSASSSAFKLGAAAGEAARTACLEGTANDGIGGLADGSEAGSGAGAGAGAHKRGEGQGDGNEGGVSADSKGVSVSASAMFSSLSCPSLSPSLSCPSLWVQLTALSTLCLTGGIQWSWRQASLRGFHSHSGGNSTKGR